MASAKLPTPDELKAVARQLGMTLSDADVTFFLETMGGTVAAYHAIEAMADPMPVVKYPRTPGYRPEKMPLEAFRPVHRRLGSGRPMHLLPPDQQ